MFMQSITKMSFNEFEKILNDNELVFVDFLATGSAMSGLINILEQANANIAGVGIVIEKNFQEGRELIQSKNIHLESLAVIKSIENGVLEFVLNYGILLLPFLDYHYNYLLKELS